MKKQKAFFSNAYNLGENRVAAGYGWPMEIDPQQLKFLAYIKQYLRNGRALDIGCGQGRHTFLLAESGFEAFGIDFLARPILEAREKAREEKNNKVHFEVMDVLELNFPDSYFDVVIDWSVLDHVYPKDWETYLKNVTRVLKKDGFLILTEFSAKDKRITDPVKNFSDEENYDHFFREDEIKSLFGENFDILLINHNELHTTSHFAMINILLRKN